MSGLGVPPQAQPQAQDGTSTTSGVAIDMPPHTDKAVPSKKPRTTMLVAAAAVLFILMGAGIGVGLWLGLEDDSTSAPPTVVEMTFVASGTVADYTTTVQNEIKAKVATEVGVASSAVALSVTSASVRLNFDITLPSAEAAQTATTALAAKTGSVSNAGTFLSVPSFTVTVEVIETAPTIVTTAATATIVAYELPVAISLVSATDGNRRQLDDVKTSSKRRRLAPTTGAYTTDAAQTYVQDRTTDMMSTPNMIVCMVTNSRVDAFINSGRYVATTDQNKCRPDARGSVDAANAEGGGGTDENLVYMSMTVNMEKAGAPMIVKSHCKMPAEGWNPEMLVFAHTNITAGVDTHPPNGRFHMDYSIQLLSNADTKIIRGQLAATADGLIWSEISCTSPQCQGQQEQPTVDAIINSGDDTNGVGAISSNGYALSFGSNAAHFCRSSDTSNYCFDRSMAAASISTWKYGLYDSQGARLELAQPMIPLKTAAAPIYYGSASYHGVHFDHDLTLTDGLAVQTHGENPTSYTVKLGKGRLLKRTISKQTLDSINKVPFRAHNDKEVTLPAGSNVPQYSEIELSWDAANQRFDVIGARTCGQNGCLFSYISGETVTAAQAKSFNHWKGMWGWSDGLMAQVLILPDTFEATSPGSFTNGISIVLETAVRIGDDTMPTSLTCVHRCYKHTTLQLADTTNDNELVSSTNTWAIPKADAIAYTWDAATYTLTDGDNNAVNKDSLPSSCVGTQGYPCDWEYGVHMDLMDTAELASLECGHDASKYCEYKIREQTTFYTFTVGLQEWNSLAFLMDSNSQVVQFSKGFRPTYTVPANTNGNEPYGDLAGANLALDYHGFGELHGIPGYCVDMETNERSDSCSGNSRYVERFSISDGETVDVGGTTYWVRALESEIRFKKATQTNAALGISLGDVANLPAAMVLTGDDPLDPRDPSNTNYAGPYAGTEFETQPCVHHGTVLDTCTSSNLA